MRALPKRPKLPKRLSKRLEQETAAILGHADQKAEAKRRYTNARAAKWFLPIVDKLRGMAAPAGRCMFCSGNEASDVEHYQPKSVCPGRAMTWENYIWSCGICNQKKGSRFPPDTEPGARLLNPIDDNVWKFFFIDDFGFLTPVYNRATGAQDERAVMTENLLDLNREGIRECRYSRVCDLRKQAEQLRLQFVAGLVERDAVIAAIVEWRKQPFQPDVADFFLNGPGRSEEPFKSLLSVVPL
jgi:hypothetical protein